MYKLILSVIMLAVATVAYAIWPLASAFQIKQAIRAHDVATLERKVHWAPVRASLKASLAELSPAMQVAGDETRLAKGQRMPSIWARVKAAAAPVLAEHFIDTYVTAEGVTRLDEIKHGSVMSMLGLAPRETARRGGLFAGYRSATPAASSGEPVEEAGALARFLNFYARIAHARFHSLSLAEFEIADRQNPARRIISQFQLSDFEWKLSSVRIVGQAF